MLESYFKVSKFHIFLKLSKLQTCKVSKYLLTSRLSEFEEDSFKLPNCSYRCDSNFNLHTFKLATFEGTEFECTSVPPTLHPPSHGFHELSDNGCCGLNGRIQLNLANNDHWKPVLIETKQQVDHWLEHRDGEPPPPWRALATAWYPDLFFSCL
jgi:hypothetical protein